jgi:hypothetical protein
MNGEALLATASFASRQQNGALRHCGFIQRSLPRCGASQQPNIEQQNIEQPNIEQQNTEQLNS